MRYSSLSNQINEILNEATLDLVADRKQNTKVASYSNLKELDGAEAMALSSLAGILRKEASWEPSYEDLNAFVGGIYGRR